jgi:hypothetical protein
MDANDADTKERVQALRLQVMAWRYVALIGLTDHERGRDCARWLLFNTIPVTNGDAVEKFIAENACFAEECGIEAGVFDRSSSS